LSLQSIAKTETKERKEKKMAKGRKTTYVHVSLSCKNIEALVAPCYRNRDKLRPDGPLGLYADLTFPSPLSKQQQQQQQ